MVLLLAACASPSPKATSPARSTSSGLPPVVTNPGPQEVEFEGIRFSYDPSLASEIVPEFIPSRFGEQYAPWDITPNHLAFTFRDPYTTARDLYWQGFSPTPAPEIFIYRTTNFPHTPAENAALDPQTNEHLAWFYAQRDGVWYYVEIGKYE